MSAIDLGAVPAFDREAVMERFGADAVLFLRVRDVFIDSTRARLPAMVDALAQGDATRVRQCAHTLRGSAATMGAMQLVVACARAESDPALAAADWLRCAAAAFQSFIDESEDRLWCGAARPVRVIPKEFSYAAPSKSLSAPP